MELDQELDERVIALRSQSPSLQAMDRIRRSLPPARPVRTLPSDSVLVFFACAGFLALCWAEGAIAGFEGFDSLTTVQKLLLYCPIAILAMLLAIAAIGMMIPGARRRVSASLAIGSAFVVLAAVSVLLFPHFRMAHFVERGLPCLKLGTVSAIPAGLLVWLLMRRGFLANPLAAATVGGGFAAFVGIAVLALHCPIQNAGHILVWHLGVIAVGIACGALLGRFLAGQAARA